MVDRQLKWRLLAWQVVLPYFRAKLDRLYARHRPRAAAKPTLQQLFGLGQQTQDAHSDEVCLPASQAEQANVAGACPSSVEPAGRTDVQQSATDGGNHPCCNGVGDSDGIGVEWPRRPQLAQHERTPSLVWLYLSSGATPAQLRRAALITFLTARICLSTAALAPHSSTLAVHITTHAYTL
jgi:hypothetical protein